MDFSQENSSLLSEPISLWCSFPESLALLKYLGRDMLLSAASRGYACLWMMHSSIMIDKGSMPGTDT